MFFFAVVPLALSYFYLDHVSIPIALGMAFSVYYVVLLGSIALYRLSPFHPLARYPGPTLYKLSSWWVYWHFVDGKRHEYIREMHHRYGSDVVRIGTRLHFPLFY